MNLTQTRAAANRKIAECILADVEVPFAILPPADDDGWDDVPYDDDPRWPLNLDR